MTWLTDTLLYTGLLIALVLLVRRPVSRYFGPRLAYALWALPALRLLLPPIELPASLGPHQVQVSDPALLALAMAADATTPPASAPTPLWERPEPWLTLWLGAAALFLAWRMANYYRMRRDLLAEARPVGEVGSIRLVETPAVSSPVAFGVRDKVVALPPRFMAMEDRAARDLAIAHELAHHRGHDILANFAAQPLLALHWFDPVAWLGWKAMRRDQEAACDARVLEGRGREERAAYAGLIAGFAAGPALALAPPMACPIIGEKSIIHRLRSLAMSDISPRRRMFGRLLLAGTALALPLTATVSYAAAPDSEVQPVELPQSDAPPAPPLGPTSPAAADAPPAPDAPIEHRQRKVIVERDRHGAVASDPSGQRHRFVIETDGPLTAEQQKRFERTRKEFETNVADWRKMAQEQAKMALAMADVREHMPDISTDCGKAKGQVSRSWTDDKGRQHIAICERIIRDQARMAQDQAQIAQLHAQMAQRRAQVGLRQAREAIASNEGMSDSVKREVLADLDKEIARLDANKD